MTRGFGFELQSRPASSWSLLSVIRRVRNVLGPRWIGRSWPKWSLRFTRPEPSQSGSTIDLADLRGPVDVKSRNTDLRLHDIKTLQPPLRLDLQSGRLALDDLQTDARIDGRDTEIRVTMARAVPLTIYDTEDTVTLFMPPDGFTLDAIATDASLSIDEAETGGVAVVKAADEREQRASGAVHGGGPSITLRNTGGDISIRKQAEKGKEKEKEKEKQKAK